MDRYTGRTPARRRAARAGRAYSISELPQHALGFGPARLHAHPHFEKDLPAEQTLHVAPRRGRDLLHPLASLAEQDRPLARLVDQHRGVDSPQLSVLNEAVDRHGRRVRNLLPQAPEDLFADEL